MKNLGFALLGLIVMSASAYSADPILRYGKREMISQSGRRTILIQGKVFFQERNGKLQEWGVPLVIKSMLKFRDKPLFLGVDGNLYTVVYYEKDNQKSAAVVEISKGVKTIAADDKHLFAITESGRVQIADNLAISEFRWKKTGTLTGLRASDWTDLADK